jgi:hypothetical protein
MILVRRHREIDRSLLRPDKVRKELVPACQVSTCRKTPDGAKPYCIDHIENNRAAAATYAGFEAIQAEVRAAKKPNGWKTIDPNSNKSLDVLEVLTRYDGEATLTRIAKDTELDHKTARAYIRALVKAGKVVVERDWHRCQWRTYVFVVDPK